MSHQFYLCQHYNSRYVSSGYTTRQCYDVDGRLDGFLCCWVCIKTLSFQQIILQKLLMKIYILKWTLDTTNLGLRISNFRPEVKLIRNDPWQENSTKIESCKAAILNKCLNSDPIRLLVSDKNCKSSSNSGSMN